MFDFHNRAFDDLTKKCEENKEKFSEFEKQDVKLREDLKHGKAKSKKLDKNVEQEKKKVMVFTLVLCDGFYTGFLRWLTLLV